MIKNLTKWMQGKGRPAPLPTPADLDAAFARQDFAAAIALTRQLADEGNAAALYRLGEVFEHGLGVLQDFGQALEWYEKAAEAGFENAWAKLGDFYLAGRGTRSGEGADADKAGAHRLLDMLSVQPDHAKALHWNRKAAQAGQAAAQAHLALQYIYGLGIEADRDEAERLFLSAAEQGSVLASAASGCCMRAARTRPRNMTSPSAGFRAASEGGDAAACMALAMLIINGHAGSGTDEDAYHLLGKAADEGNVEAMLYLGSLYRDGRGTAQDLSVAETWFRRASVRGNRNATLSLGFLLTEMIEPRDYVSGASIFREAAEQGDPVGQYVLGKLYLAGLGVPQDDEKAYGWLAQAAEQELMQAIETLAALTAGGRGVEANTSAAIRLFERAAEAGSIDAPYHKGDADDGADTARRGG
jgi:TPR repeat protein